MSVLSIKAAGISSLNSTYEHRKNLVNARVYPKAGVGLLSGIKIEKSASIFATGFCDNYPIDPVGVEKLLQNPSLLRRIEPTVVTVMRVSLPTASSSSHPSL